jgi:hypothetical protein
MNAVLSVLWLLSPDSSAAGTKAWRSFVSLCPSKLSAYCLRSRGVASTAVRGLPVVCNSTVTKVDTCWASACPVPLLVEQALHSWPGRWQRPL